MVWIPAAISAASSIYGSMSSGKAAKKAQAQRDRDIADSKALLTGELNRQRGIYGPLEERTAADFASDTPRYWGAVRGNILGQFDNARRSTEENLAATGDTGNAGVMQALDLEKAKTLGGQYQQALEQQRQGRVAFLGRYNPSALVSAAAQPGMTSAGYNNQDMLLNRQDEMMGYAAAGQAINNGVQAYMDSQRQPQQVVTPPPPDPIRKTPNPPMPNEQTVQTPTGTPNVPVDNSASINSSWGVRSSPFSGMFPGRRRGLVPAY